MRMSRNLHIRKKFPVICIDGGPCSGKTTAIPKIVSWLESIGRIPIFVPESATIFKQSGFQPEKNGLCNFEFQRQLLYFNMEKEDRMIEAARRLENPNVVVLCDRGTMNAQAYMAPGEFERLIEAERLDLVALRDKRYDTVIHLRSAAFGAEAHYQMSDVRQETPEQARERDQKTLEAWVGAPHLYIIDNRTDFKGKIERLKHVVAHAIGYPEPREMEKRFLMVPTPPSKIPAPATALDITQVYLVNNHAVECIRRRMQIGHGAVYFHTIKTGASGNLSEIERKIDEATFYRLFQTRRDLSFNVVRKTRYCFVWNNHYYELDYFIEPLKDLCILEAEQYLPNQHIEIPIFLTPALDITTHPSYSNYRLAKM